MVLMAEKEETGAVAIRISHYCKTGCWDSSKFIDFILFYVVFFLFEWQSYRKRKGERDKEKEEELPSADSLLRWPQ